MGHGIHPIWASLPTAPGLQAKVQHPKPSRAKLRSLQSAARRTHCPQLAPGIDKPKTQAQGLAHSFWGTAGQADITHGDTAQYSVQEKGTEGVPAQLG